MVHSVSYFTVKRFLGFRLLITKKMDIATIMISTEAKAPTCAVEVKSRYSAFLSGRLVMSRTALFITDGDG